MGIYVVFNGQIESEMNYKLKGSRNFQEGTEEGSWNNRPSQTCKTNYILLVGSIF